MHIYTYAGDQSLQVLFFKSGTWFPGPLLKVPVPRGVFSGYCTRGAACAVD